MRRSALRRSQTPLTRGRLRRVSKKTRTERWPVLKALREHVLTRARGRCECTGALTHGGPLDVHHCVKRSQGGKDTPDNAVLLCRVHHDMTDFPLAKGRLVVLPQGEETFQFEMIYAADKWAAR
jgi:5-methylcytosine-specific restriction endonuclease McrA